MRSNILCSLIPQALQRQKNKYEKKFYKMLCVLTAAVFCMTAPAVVQAAQNEKQTEAAQEEEIEDRKSLRNLQA